MRDVLHCPVCGGKEHLGHLLKIRELEPFQRNAFWWTPERLTAYLAHGEIRWACEDCLTAGRALRADPSKQTFGIHGPHLAYIDRTATCTDCHQPFTFPATEQRYWYEELRFLIYAQPKQCRPCRRRRRERKLAAAELGALLPTVDQRNPHHLIQVADLYLRMGVNAKGLEYLRRAKNQASDPDLIRTLAQRIESERLTKEDE